MVGKRHALPPGCSWADGREAMAVVLDQMDRCAETLRRLTALDADEGTVDEVQDGPRSTDASGAETVLKE